MLVINKICCAKFRMEGRNDQVVPMVFINHVVVRREHHCVSLAILGVLGPDIAVVASNFDWVARLVSFKI